MTDNRPYIELEFTGTTLTQHTSNTLIGTDIVIDYGDGTTVNYTGDFSHTYSASGDYTIRIYGVTGLGDRCFYGCSGLTSVKLSNIITSLGELCFYGCSGLTSIRIPNSVTIIIKHCFLECSSLTKIFFEWSSSTDIITYNQYWFSDVSSIDLIIPMGTTSLYTAKGYPSNRLYDPVLFGSLKIGGKTVKALQIAGKLIQSITRVSDGKVLYFNPSWITAEPSILQSEDTTDVYANTPLNDSGYKVHFFEKVTPVFTLFAEPNPIQSGDTSDVYTIVKDSDGSRVVGEPVYFFTDKVLNALSVSSDKDVLSYADGDKAVLTAKLTGESVSGKSVVFKQGDTVLDTETTDSNGQASYEYTSQGIGDVTITAECMSLQETYELEDCINYDNALLDNTSKYILTNITSLTHSNNAYTVVSGASSSTSNYFGLVSFKDTTIPSNFKASVDMKFTHSGTELHHTLMPTNNLTNSANSIVGVQLGEFRVNYGIITRPWKDSEVSRTGGQLSSNTWYTFELEYNNGVWTGTIIVNDSVLWTGTVTASKTINYIGIAESGGNNTFQFKNLKVKPL